MLLLVGWAFVSMGFSLVRIFARAARVDEAGEADPQLPIWVVKEDPGFVSAANDRAHPEGKSKKTSHQAPGLEKHSKDQNDCECRKRVGKFPEVEDEYGRIDCLTDPVAVLPFEKRIGMHN